MLKKLLKYDFRANLKVFVFVWPAILLVAVIARFIFWSENDSFLFFLVQSNALTLFVIVLVAAMAFSYIFSTIRFYAGLLGKEGYLMFTLPVKPWQLILSKFISAMTYAVATLTLCILAVLLQYIGKSDFFKDLKAFLPERATLLLTLAIAFMNVCGSLLQIYCAISLGHLFRKKRLFWAILIWYGFNVVTQVVQLCIFMSESFFLKFMGSFSNFADVTLLIVLLVQSALCVSYFFVSERILTKKLNLE